MELSRENPVESPLAPYPFSFSKLSLKGRQLWQGRRMPLHPHYTLLLKEVQLQNRNQCSQDHLWQASHLLTSYRELFASFKMQASITYAPQVSHWFFNVKSFKNPTYNTVWFSYIWSIFCENKKLQIEALDTECKLLWCQQQQLGRTSLFTTSFGQKAEVDFYWPTPVASETCNRKALYLPQRGMDIKEEGPINVVTSHLPKMSFIPTGKNTPTKHKPQ